MSPSLESAFSAARLRRLAGSRSFDRGHAYADSGRVKRVEIGNQEARAAVRGSREYSVRLWLEGGEPCFSCTCPLGDDQVFCKHCVALGLPAFARRHGEAEIWEAIRRGNRAAVVAIGLSQSRAEALAEKIAALMQPPPIGGGDVQ